MMRWLLTALLIMGGYGGELEKRKDRPDRVQIPVGWSMNLAMTIGNPPQPIRTLLSFEFSELILVDSLCGVRRRDCPRYCNDKKFAQIHCSARCQAFTQQNALLYCRGSIDQLRYDGRNSSTSKNLGVQWNRRREGSRRINGNLWSDEIRFVRTGFGRRDTVLNLTGQRFVSGDMFDLRTPLDESAHGFFGMKPTADSAIQQILNDPSIRHNIVSIAGSPDDMELLRRGHYDTLMMTVGELDMARCVDWEWYPSASNESFMLAASRADFLGQTFRQNFTIVFKFSEVSHFVPSEIYEASVRSGRLDPGIPWSSFKCPFHIYRNPLTFTVGGKRLRFRTQSLTLYRYRIRNRPGEFACSSYMDAAPVPKFTWEQLQWSVGFTFFGEHCIAFDYKQMRIAVGRRRFKEHPDLNDGNTRGSSSGDDDVDDDEEMRRERRMGLRRVGPLN